MLGGSWVSGINLYATVGFLGLFSRIGWLSLPENLQMLAHPAVFITALVLYLVEFIADKVPIFDSVWDGVHTFIRVPAGAILAWGSVGGAQDELKVMAALLGGGIAFSSHATKASLRALVNTSPEPFSNWALSLAEDALVILCLWLMLDHPYIMLTILLLFLIFFIWFIPKIFRLFRAMFRRFINLFRKKEAPAH